MSIDEAVLEKLRDLPPEKQQEVLDFIEFLREKSRVGLPQRSLRGLWADLGIDIGEDDIVAARREMWRDFPRDDVA